MNEYQETYEKEISLMELMFYCLKKWRWIVVSMVLVAVVAGGYKYLSTVKGNQLIQQKALLDKENEGEEPEGAQEGTIKNPNVAYYEQLIANSEQKLEKQEVYMRDSVIMQLDSRQLQTVTVSFYLNAANEQGIKTLESLLAAYEAYVGDGRLAEQLYGIETNISKAELQYLLLFICEGKDTYRSTSIEGVQIPTGNMQIQTEAPEQMLFQVQAIVPEEGVCEEYLDKIEEAILDYSRQLQSEVGAHELKPLASVQSEMASDDIQKYQENAITSYMTLLTNLQTLKKGMKTVIDEEGEMIIVSGEVTLANPVSVGVKFAIVGLVLGAFLAAFLLILIYLMSGKLQSTDAFREEFGMHLLGEVKAPVGKKKIFGFVDTWLYHLEEGAYANISRDEQIRIAVASLKGAASQKEGLKKIMLTGTIAKEDVAEFCNCLKEHVQEIIFSDYRQIVFDAAALEELDGYDAVVFLERKGVSYSKLVKQERELASRRDVQILGTVVI